MPNLLYILLILLHLAIMRIMKKDYRSDFQARQYMVARDFEIFYYSDRGMRRLSSHSHDFFEFYFFVEGEGTLHIGKKSVRLAEGCMAVIAPGTPHYVELMDPEAPYRRFVFWISEEYLKGLSGISEDYLFLPERAKEGSFVFRFTSVGFHVVEGKLFSLISEMKSDRFGREAKRNLCAQDLLLHVSRAVYEEEHPKQRGAEHENLYQSVLSYIEEHISEPLTLDSLAEVFFVSKFHISHIFSENMGISLHRYITKKRLSMCLIAILGGESAGEACLSYGFSDYSGFYRAFVKEYGKSPKQYKDEHSYLWKTALEGKGS